MCTRPRTPTPSAPPVNEPGRNEPAWNESRLTESGLAGPGGAHPISVVGLVGESFGPDARIALGSATVVVGSKRQLALTAELQQGDGRADRTAGPASRPF